MSSKDLVPKGDSAEETGSALALAPLMYAHLLLTRDTAQHREWRDRLEKIEQANELAEVTDPKERALIARPEVWKDLRRMSWWANVFTAGWCTWVTADLVKDYAVGFGFGYAQAGTYLLGIPIGWLVGRRVYQSAMVWVMKNLGSNPDSGGHLKSWMRAIVGAFGAGFAFSFTMTFLQGLISWFMTPAPTLWLELYMDVANAFQAACYAGMISSVMWPLLCRRPGTAMELTEAPAVPALPAR